MIALIPILPADDIVGMDISEVVAEVPLPESLARTTCHSASRNASSTSWRWQNSRCAI